MITFKAMRQLLESPVEFTREDVAFHVYFYRAMKNDVLLMMMEAILQLLGEMMQVTFLPQGSAEISLKRHEKLFECIRARDPEGARQVMQGIISRGRERLQETWQVGERTATDNQETVNATILP